MPTSTFSGVPLDHIAVFAATPWEFQAVAHSLPAGRVEWVEGFKWRRWEHPSYSVAVIQTGVGPAHAQAASRVAFARGPWTVGISSGFAGALVPSRVGDLVIPDEVVCGASDEGSFLPAASISCSAFYRQQAHAAAQFSQSPVVRGRLVTVKRIVGSVQEKESIGRACDASSLDMESAAIGAVAMYHRVPFVVVRAISDLADEHLPRVLNLFCRPATFIHGMWAVVTTPRIWPTLHRLHRQTNLASAQLTQFFTTFFRMASEPTYTERT